MENGIVYTAENSLYEGVLKIGMTLGFPNERMRQLNRQTGVLGKFSLISSTKFNNARSAEIRIHMLLKGVRVDPNKEFFEVTSNESKQLITNLSQIEEFHKTRAIERYELRNDLILAIYNWKTTSVLYSNLITVMQCYTIDNSTLDIMMNFPNNRVSFISSYDIELNTNKSHSVAIRQMKIFYKNCKNLKVSLKNGQEIKVFEYLDYHKGELGWVFTRDYKALFKNDYT